MDLKVSGLAIMAERSRCGCGCTVWLWSHSGVVIARCVVEVGECRL